MNKTANQGGIQQAAFDYLHLYEPRKKIKLLYEPHGYAEGMARGNLGWQMEYSATTLEEALAAEGNPHLLQLALHGPDRREPEAWKLYADGELVAAGDGAWARACFVRRADEFRDVLRAAVEAAGLEPLTAEAYRILKTARGVRAVAHRLRRS